MVELDIWLLRMIALALGFVAGFLSGLLGVGGGWLLTPGLNILGMPMATAVGTSLTQMIGASFMGCLRHSKKNRIVWPLVALLGIPILSGVYAGKQLMVYWHHLGMSDSIPRVIFILVMLVMGCLMIYRNHNQRKRKILIIQRDLSLRLKAVIVACSFPIGILSGILGMGGGFFMVPLLTYFIGLPVEKASATSLFAILMGSFVGSLSYWADGLVDIPTALFLLAGSISGAYWGAGASNKVDSSKLRQWFSYLVLIAAFAMALRHYSFNALALMVLFGAALGLTLAAVRTVVLSGRASARG